MGVEQEESGTHNPGCIWTDRVCMKTARARDRERERARRGGENWKQSEGNALQGSVRQRERKQMRVEER